MMTQNKNIKLKDIIPFIPKIIFIAIKDPPRKYYYCYKYNTDTIHLDHPEILDYDVEYIDHGGYDNLNEKYTITIQLTKPYFIMEEK